MGRVRRDSEGRIVVVVEDGSIFDGVRVVIRFAEIDGRPEPVHVEVGPRFDVSGQRDPRPISAEWLRDLPFGRMVKQARRRNLRTLEAMERAETYLDGRSPPPVDREAVRKAVRAAQAAARGRGGAPRYVDDLLPAVAEVYTEAWRQGERPTLAVARTFFKDRSTAGKWVARARALGLLPPTTRGKANAAPTPKKTTRPQRGQKEGKRP